MAGLIERQTPFAKLNIINYDQVGWDDPLSENFYVIDALIQQFSEYHQIRGLWKNATLYQLNDTVVDVSNGALWKCAVSHTSSSTGSFLADRTAHPTYWVSVTTGVISDEVAYVTPEGFGATGDGVDDDTVPVINSINYAVTNKKAWRGTKKYRMTSAHVINLPSGSTLDMQGGEIISDINSGTLLALRASPVGVYSVLEIVSSTVDLSHGVPSTKLTTTHRIRCPGHTFTGNGEVCKIISDDPIPQIAAATFFSVGEFNIVVAVDGDYIYLAAPLRNAGAYVTNVRIVHIDKTTRLFMRDVKFYSDLQSNIDNGRNTVYLELTGFVSPLINNIRGRFSTYAVVRSKSCFGTFASQCYFTDGINDESAGRPGRGWESVGCELETMLQFHGENVANTMRFASIVTDNTDVLSYGESYGCIIANSTDASAYGAAFVAGPGSRSLGFINIFTKAPTVGENGAGAGIRLYGGDHYVNGHRHDGSNIGILITTLYSTENTDHYIDGLDYTGTNVAIDASTFAASTNGRFHVNNMRVKTTASNAAKVGAIEAIMTNVYADMRQTGSISSIFTLSTGALLKLLGANNVFRFDLGFSGSRVCDYVGLCRIRIEGTVVVGSNTWESVVKCLDGSPNASSFIRTRVKADKLPTGHYSGVMSTGTAKAAGYVDTEEAASGATNSGYASQTLASGNNTLTLDNSLAPVVIRNCVCSGTSRVINSIEAGFYAGQMLVILGASGNSNSFTLQANAGNRISIPIDATIAALGGVMFIWQDSTWMSVTSNLSASGGGVTAHSALTGLAADDHTQYHTDARAASWLATKNITALANIASTTGNAGKYAKLNVGLTGLDWGDPLGTKLTDLNSYLGSIYDFTPSGGQPRLRVINLAAAVKFCVADTHTVVGGDDSARVGSEVLTVVGSAYFTGGIDSGTVVGNYTNFGLVGAIRFWDDGSGNIRIKNGADPANATDGSILTTVVAQRMVLGSDLTCNSATHTAWGATLAYVSGTYKFKALMNMKSTDVNSGFTVRMNFSGGSPSISGIARSLIAAGSTAAERVDPIVSSGGGCFSTAVQSANTNTAVQMEGIFTVSGSGTVTHDFRPEDTGGTVTATLVAGSFLEIEKIA